MSEEVKNDEVVDVAPVADATPENDVVVEDTPVSAPVEEPAKEEAKPAENVISSGSSSSASAEPAEVAGLTAVSNGVIGTGKVAPKPKPAPKVVKPVQTEKVAVYSSRNATWNGVGKVYRGYNIVTKEQSDQWLKRDHVRLATPEEVAKEFGK